MPVSEEAIGRQGVITVRVDESQSAASYGNPGLSALATPALVGLMERAAMEALDGLIELGERTVGSVVELEHQAPTPVGTEVEVRATVQAVDGPKVWFTTTATDPSGQIAAGRHARFVVDDERFQKRLKSAAVGG